MKLLRITIIKTIFLIIIFTALAIFFVTRNDLEEIIKLLSTLSFIKIFMLALIPIFQFIITGIILKLIINKFDPNYGLMKSINLSFIGGFISGITPSSTGGQISQVYILTKNKVSIDKAFGVVWLDFLFFQITLMIQTDACKLRF